MADAKLDGHDHELKVVLLALLKTVNINEPMQLKRSPVSSSKLQRVQIPEPIQTNKNGNQSITNQAKE